jgi:hypothetical protein
MDWVNNRYTYHILVLSLPAQQALRPRSVDCSLVASFCSLFSCPAVSFSLNSLNFGEGVLKPIVFLLCVSTKDVVKPRIPFTIVCNIRDRQHHPSLTADGTWR